MHLNRTGGATALIGLDIAGVNRGLIGATTTAAFVSYSSAAASLVTVANTGGVQFNTYGAGTLVTDASGNITASSGGGAGGPYLPLAGGTLTGALTGTSGYFNNNLTTRGVLTIQAGNPYIQWNNAAGTRLGYIQHSTNLVMNADSGQIVLNTAANNDILINPGGTGKVGIGTTSPGAKLEVNSDGFPQVRINDEATAVSYTHLTLPTNREV